MRAKQFVVYLSLTLGPQHAMAQDATRNAALSTACLDFNRTMLDQLARGALKEAESSVSGAISTNLGQSCAWVTQYNMALVLTQSGSLAKAEPFAEQALRTLGTIYPPGDLILLRPLGMLASIQFKQGKIGKARETFRKMQSIHIELPADRAQIGR